MAEPTHQQPLPDIAEAEAVEDAAALPPASKPAGRRFGRDALTVGGSRFITRGATFLTGILIARILGPEGRGLVAALSVPASLSASLSELGTRQAAAYHIGRKTFPIEKLVATLMGMLPVASLLAVGGALLYYRVSGTGGTDLGLQLLAVAAVPCSIGTAYATGILLGRGKITKFSRASWMPAVIALIFVAIAVWGLGWQIRGVLLATALGNAVGFGYALWIVRQEVPLRIAFDRTIVRAVQRLGLSYAIATFVLLLNFKIMILLLSRISTLEQVGLYAQAAAIAEMLLEVPTMVTSILFSRAVNSTDREAMSRKICSLARMTLLITLAMSVAVAVAAPIAFPLIYGKAYVASAGICVALLPGVVALVYFRIIQQDIHARGKAWISTAVIAPILVLNVALGYILVERFGAIGAGVASSATYVLAAVIYIIAYSRLIGVPIREILRFSRADFEQVLHALPLPRRFRPSR